MSTGSQAERIIELAASLENVSDVDYTDLKISNSRPLATDEWITAKVQGRIIQLFNNNKISDGYDLTVETNNRQVHIFGTISKVGDIAVSPPLWPTQSNLHGPAAQPLLVRLFLLFL